MQVFLQGKLLGLDAFVSSGGPDFQAFAGRCLYCSILSEAIPRAVLDHCGLSHQLLGASGGGHFLLVLTDESLPAANEFLVAATRRLAEVSSGLLRLAWSSTENLGDWSDVRKRLQERLEQWRGLNALEPEGFFQPFAPTGTPDALFRSLYATQPTSLAVRFDLESALLLAPAGEPLPLAHHAAPDAAGEAAASLAVLADRANGAKVWGILRADVDQFAHRLRRAQTIEEHLQISVFFRQFFSGEVQVLCSQGEFWQKVTVLYTGGDDFAVAGAWDSLIPFAREMERLFKISVEEFLKEFPGPEGKSLSMAIALASRPDASPSDVFAEAGQLLGVAKASSKDCIHLLGKALDWKQLTAAAELKNTMLRMVNEFGCSPQFLSEMASFYRETDRILPSRASRQRAVRQERPWRFHRRLSRVLERPSKHREFQKVKNNLLAEFIGRNQSQVKLKPSGRVALQWARLAQDI